MSRTLYIEPNSGIAGDMFVAAISDLIPTHKHLLEDLNSLPIRDEFSISFKTVQKNGITAKCFNVETADAKSCTSTVHDHGRTLKDITKIINAADKITPDAKNIAVDIFKNLARAEAAVHGADCSSVHFHEVGAVDAIVDITAAAILLDTLKIEKIISAPVALGQGTVKSAHGIIPIPSPATVELLMKIPVNHTTVNTELTTPTGAAILTTITDEWISAHSGTMLKTGYGAGTKDIKDIPNVLRVSLFESKEDSSNADEIVIIECNLDDYPTEHLSFLGPELLKNGALDFAVIPATMKKGRQGIIIQVLCPPAETQNLASLLLRETTTLGVRYRTEKRIILERQCRTIETPLGKLNIKLAMDKGKIIKAKPEQYSIEKISKEQNKSYFEAYKYLDYCTQQWLQKNTLIKNR